MTTFSAIFIQIVSGMVTGTIIVTLGKYFLNTYKRLKRVEEKIDTVLELINNKEK